MVPGVRDAPITAIERGRKMESRLGGVMDSLSGRAERKPGCHAPAKVTGDRVQHRFLVVLAFVHLPTPIE